MLRILLELRFLRMYFSMLRIFGSNRSYLLRAIHCTKYNLWTRNVDYGVAQLSVRADRKKGSLGNHSNDGSGNFLQKSFVVYSKILYVQNTFQLCWNETAISGLEKKHVVKSLPPCNYKTSHFKSLGSFSNDDGHGKKNVT